MHLKVLGTRRPVRGVRMKVGPNKKDVIVNVAPVIVDGILKGSVGVIHDVSEIKTLTAELNRARQIIRTLEAKYTFDDIIGTSEQMLVALEQAKLGRKRRRRFCCGVNPALGKNFSPTPSIMKATENTINSSGSIVRPCLNPC